MNSRLMLMIEGEESVEPPVTMIESRPFTGPKEFPQIKERKRVFFSSENKE